MFLKNGVHPVFDHWLTNDEIQSNIIFYGDVKNNDINSNDYKQYLNYEKKFLSFYKSLFIHYKVYGVSFSDNNVEYIEFDSVNAFCKRMLLSIREVHFLTIIIPEIFSVFVGNHDLTHLLYRPKLNLYDYSKIDDLVDHNGLYYLPSKNGSKGITPIPLPTSRRNL